MTRPFSMTPRYDRALNASMLDMARADVSKMVHRFQAQLAAIVSLPKEEGNRS